MSQALAGGAYPPARPGGEADDFHGDLVADPYRWLEDSAGPQAAAWADEQNRLTGEFLAGVPERAQIMSQLAALWDFPRYGVPFQRGARWFQLRNPGLAEQAVLHMMDGPLDRGWPLLDPAALSQDGTVAVTGIHLSPDGALLAYATSAAGSDWKSWHVRDVAARQDLADLVQWSDERAAWRADGSGFYYTAWEPPSPGRPARRRVRGIAFHALGTGQAQDHLILDTSAEPDWLPVITVTGDGRYLVATIRRGLHSQTHLLVLDLQQAAGRFHPLVPPFAARSRLIGNIGSVFYLVTDDSADRCRIVAVDLDYADRDEWRVIVPEAAQTLLEGHLLGGTLVCHYLRDAASVLRVHALDGALIREIGLPGMAGPVTLGGGWLDHHAIEGSADYDTVLFEVESFTESGALWEHDLGTGQTRLVRQSPARLDPARFITEQVLVPSQDGTPVPVFLVRRRDIIPDGQVPVLLYGYGGVGIPVTPAFSVPWAVWLERGGLLAVACLRGGGEHGRAWHEAGRRAAKQNTFDDFCACMRWLADSGWSRPGRIAIAGGSNGGLLVGACLTQHPELMGAAVAQAGVHDMLRFHRFTIGWAWIPEYGDPGDPEQYRWLRGYSPLHNVAPGTRYPAVLLLTGDHDDRVAPAHSLKFAAALQAAQAGDAPVLLRVARSAGHGAGAPASMKIAEAADWLAFVTAALR